jgi:hypothetical protein
MQSSLIDPNVFYTAVFPNTAPSAHLKADDSFISLDAILQIVPTAAAVYVQLEPLDVLCIRHCAGWHLLCAVVTWL